MLLRFLTLCGLRLASCRWRLCSCSIMAMADRAVQLRTANPTASTSQLFSQLIQDKVFIENAMLIPATDQPRAVEALVPAVSGDVLPNQLRSFLAPGQTIPGSELSDAPPPGIGGERRPSMDVTVGRGDLAEALNLSPQQSQQLTAASRFDPQGVASATSQRAIQNALPDPRQSPPTIHGLLPEQEANIRGMWQPDKPADFVKAAVEQVGQNRETMAALEGTVNSSNLLTNDDPGGELERAINLVETEQNLAAGRGSVLRHTVYRASIDVLAKPPVPISSAIVLPSIPAMRASRTSAA